MDKKHTSEALGRLGKVTAIAARYDVSRQTIYDWLNLGIPELRCYQVAHDTGYDLEPLLAECRPVKKVA